MIRRGFVLAAALLVIVLIGALVAGVFFATMEETHIADTAALREAALIAAESALETTIAGWSDRSLQQIGVAGEELSTISNGGLAVRVSVIRLDSTLYSLVAQARSSPSQSVAMRRVGVIVTVKERADHSRLVEPVSERWWSELF